MMRSAHLSMALISFAVGLLFTSCDSYYFAGPQPADREDERSFPRAMRGHWIDVTDNEETGTDVIQTDRLQTIYNIDRQRIITIEVSSVKLLDRTLTLGMDEGERSPEAATIPSRREERYDSSAGRIDTIDNFILHGDLIHPVDENRLRKGYPFRRQGDTIFFMRRDTTIRELGQLLRLRKAARDLYVLNFRNGVSGDAPDWWEVLLVRPGEKALEVYGAGKRMEDLPARFYERNSNHYLNLNIRADELEGMIRDSVFIQGMRLERE